MKLIPLDNIADDKVLWRGTKIRIFNNLQDYDDYMLVHIPSDNGYLYLVNVTQNNINDNGATMCSVKMNSINSEINVLAKDLKFSIGIENTYLIDNNI